MCYVLDSTYHLENFNNTQKDIKVIWHLGWSTAFPKKKWNKKTLVCIWRFFARSKGYVCNNEFTVENPAFWWPCGCGSWCRCSFGWYTKLYLIFCVRIGLVGHEQRCSASSEWEVLCAEDHLQPSCFSVSSGTEQSQCRIACGIQ